MRCNHGDRLGGEAADSLNSTRTAPPQPTIFNNILPTTSGLQAFSLYFFDRLVVKVLIHTLAKKSYLPSLMWCREFNILHLLLNFFKLAEIFLRRESTKNWN